MQPEQERKDRKEQQEDKVQLEQKVQQELRVLAEKADKEQDKDLFNRPELKRMEEFLEAIRQGAEIDTESEKSSVSAKSSESKKNSDTVKGPDSGISASAKKSTPPKTVPVDVMRSGTLKPKSRIIPPYTQESNWAPIIKFRPDLPLFVFSQLNRQFIHEIDPLSPSFFYQTKAKTIHLNRPVENGTVSILRYNLFENRLVMEVAVYGGDDEVPEIPSVQPIFLPTGTCPIPGTIFEFNQTRNLANWYFRMRLHPELDTLEKADFSGSLSRSQEPQKWLDFKGLAADGLRNSKEYLNGGVTHFHLTGLADFVVINPTPDCRFDILPEKEPDKPYQLGKEDFEGILTVPDVSTSNKAINPNQHSEIHGIVVKVEDYNDKRLYLNHPSAGKVWGLTLKIGPKESEGPKIEILCLRHVVSHQKHKTQQDQSNPTYEDSVVAPKVGDRVYAKAMIQAFSADDQLNLPITSDTKPRVFRNICSVSKEEPGEEKSQREKEKLQREYDNFVFHSKRTKKGDPNKFFIHTSTILRPILPAEYSSPLMARFSFETIGYFWRFPKIEKPARYADEENDENDQNLDLPPGTLLAEFLANAKKPPTADPLCSPSPETHCSQSKPDPRLLSNLNPEIQEPKERQELQISTYKNPFNIVLEYIHYQEALLYGRTSKTSYQLLKQNYKYWYNLFKKLNLDFHILFPDAKDPKSLPGLFQWVKVLCMQQAFAFHKRQLDLELVSANQLMKPFKKEAVDALMTQFRSRKHACGLCNGGVQYGEHMDKGLAKVSEIIQMACRSCLGTKLWKPEEARRLWGIPEKQLNELRAWRIAKQQNPFDRRLDDVWFTTEDLYYYFIKMHAQLSKPFVFVSDEQLQIYRQRLSSLKEQGVLDTALLAHFESIIQKGEKIRVEKEKYLEAFRVEKEKFLKAHDSFEITRSVALEMQKRMKDLPPLVRSLVIFEDTFLEREPFISPSKDSQEESKEMQEGRRILQEAIDQAANESQYQADLEVYEAVIEALQKFPKEDKFRP